MGHGMIAAAVIPNVIEGLRPLCGHDHFGSQGPAWLDRQPPIRGPVTNKTSNSRSYPCTLVEPFSCERCANRVQFRLTIV